MSTADSQAGLLEWASCSLFAGRGNRQWTGMAGDPAGACRQFAALQSAAKQILGPEHPGTVAIRDGLAW